MVLLIFFFFSNTSNQMPVCKNMSFIDIIIIFFLFIENKDTASLNLTLKLPVTKTAEFANSVDLDEVAHNEPPHVDLHCLPCSP